MNTRAFTLIETMVAVTILTLSVAGPLFTASRAIVAAQTARDQLATSYLAQEGVEYVRALRDDEYLASYPDDTSDAWNNFLDESIDKCREPKICTLGRIQDGNPRLVRCQQQQQGQDDVCTATFSLLPNGTPYQRTIQVINASPGGATDVTDVRVVSTVSWSFHGIPHSVSISNHLTSWQ